MKPGMHEPTNLDADMSGRSSTGTAYPLASLHLAEGCG
jgi:hypothetical protein